MSNIDLRQKNLIWTVAHDYSIFLPNDLDISDFDYFQVLNLAYALSLDINNDLLDYLKYLESIDRHKTFRDIFLLAINSFSYEKLYALRPSLAIHKKNYHKKYKDKYNNYNRLNIVDELRYTQAERYYNSVPKTSKDVKNLADEIDKFHIYKTIDELIDNFEKLVDGNFHFSASIKEKSENKARNGFKKKKKKSLEISEDLLDQYYGLIGSAEFTTDLNLDGIEKDEEKKILKLSDEEVQTKNKYLIAQNLYGINILNTRQKVQLEKEICQGNHRHISLILSKGEYLDNIEGNFRQKQLMESYEENLDYIKFRENLLMRNKTTMVQELKSSIVKSIDINYNKSKQGKLISSKIYRSKYINDLEIFEKKTQIENTDLSVDILIDGSASQLDRKNKIAAWVYTISEALAELMVPTRVMTFSNLENYLGLTLYRNYYDEKKQNLNILNFSPAGSNRDGLAFRLIDKLMDENKHSHKLLIYLTDGKPFDVRSRVDNNYKNEEKEYRGKFAEMDTAIEFRKLEKKGIYTLAVFTGSIEDLPGMKKIYGNNFVYIKDLDRFANIFTKYVKKILED